MHRSRARKPTAGHFSLSGASGAVVGSMPDRVLGSGSVVSTVGKTL